MPLRIIGHLDMDAFFAAIEERDTPRFRGLPIVVGADPRGGRGRGVVSTANYPARAYGIRSAQPISTAWRLAEAARQRGQPATLFLPGDVRKYGETSRHIMAIIRGIAPVVQKRSVDEAYFDLSFTGGTAAALGLCRNLKEEIRAREHLTASVGIGPNKLIAKIASDFQKPDGLTLVEEGEAESFLAPLLIRVVPGVGPKTEVLLRARGIRSVQDARALTREEWHALLGKWGRDLSEKIWGRDDAPLEEASLPQSLGKHVTFAEDTCDPRLVGEHVAAMCAQLTRRLSEGRFQSFRTVVLTVRFADFRTVSRAHTLPIPLHTRRDLHREALRLLLPFFDARENPRHERLRLIGLRLERLRGGWMRGRPVDGGGVY